MKLISAARVCHESMNAYKNSIGEGPIHWTALPEWKKESIANGVRVVLENPGIQPAAVHANWVADMAIRGWTHGEAVDREAKTHPGIRPYEDLAPEQQAKTRLFIAVVESIRPLIRHDGGGSAGGGAGAHFPASIIHNMHVYQY